MREKAEKEDEERVARGEAPSEKGPQWRPGVAYEGKQLATSHNFHKGVDVFAEPEKVILRELVIRPDVPSVLWTSMCTWMYISAYTPGCKRGGHCEDLRIRRIKCGLLIQPVFSLVLA